MTIDWRVPRTEAFIERHIDEVNWIDISCFQRLSESFIEKYSDKLFWSSICTYQKLSEPFIEKHIDEVDGCCVSHYQKLSEPFMKKYAYKLVWSDICIYQKLSEEFMEENKYLCCWPNIKLYQKLSSAFRKRCHIPTPENNWLYKSTASKKKAVQNTGLYECHKDYFIAYKAIRKDRYSCFNFQYKYEKGGVYETHADYTDEEDSFGFGAGIKTYAKSYGRVKQSRHYIVVRVKIYYKDVARVVYDGKKIRACKIEVLD